MSAIIILVDDGLFSMEIDTKCYCGRHIKLMYDEEIGQKDVECKHCGYKHFDLVYMMREELEAYFSSK